MMVTSHMSQNIALRYLGYVSRYLCSATFFKVFANDSDGDYNVITYSIVSGDHGNNFTINSTTGVITTATPLDKETQTQFYLTVRASDSMYCVSILFRATMVHISIV
jgi:hypothetical protein